MSILPRLAAIVCMATTLRSQYLVSSFGSLCTMISARGSTILNDSINLGLRGEYVSLLIPAGTELPYKSEEIRDQYKLDKATNVIGIEMFLGRGTTKNLPNRRIATRVVKFTNVYPANKQAIFQFVILNEESDEKLAKFFENFFKPQDLNKWIADVLIRRYGRGTSKTNQKKLAKLVKLLSGGLNVQDRNNIPPFLVVLIAELCRAVKEISEDYLRYKQWKTESERNIANNTERMTLIDKEIEIIKEKIESIEERRAWKNGNSTR